MSQCELILDNEAAPLQPQSYFKLHSNGLDREVQLKAWNGQACPIQIDVQTKYITLLCSSCSVAASAAC